MNKLMCVLVLVVLLVSVVLMVSGRMVATRAEVAYETTLAEYKAGVWISRYELDALWDYEPRPRATERAAMRTQMLVASSIGFGLMLLLVAVGVLCKRPKPVAFALPVWEGVQDDLL